MSEPDPFAGFPMPPCAQTLGWRFVALDREAQRLSLGFDGKPEFANPAGNVQGGFLAAMLDDTMAPLVILFGEGGRPNGTIDLNVQYLRRVKPGAISTHARVLRIGRSVAFLEGELFDAEGNLCTRSTASYAVARG